MGKKITSDVNELRKALRQKMQPAPQGTSQPTPPSPRKTRSAASSPFKSALKRSEDVSPSKPYALMSGHNHPDGASSPTIADMDINSIPSRPGPSTPRRTPRSTSQNQTKITGHELAMEVDQASDRNRSASPPPQPRRFRPIFIDRKQWLSRDPRISRGWPAMMEHKKSMINLYGHPFATQMPDLQMQDV